MRDLPVFMARSTSAWLRSSSYVAAVAVRCKAPPAPPASNVDVLNDTADLYRYFDCTAEAKFLYECVARTVEYDLPEEIKYLRRHDEAQRRIMETVEMPDRLAQNLIMFIRQNGGTLPRKRREKEFAALTDEEVNRIEAIYNDVFTNSDE